MIYWLIFPWFLRRDWNGHMVAIFMEYLSKICPKQTTRKRNKHFARFIGNTTHVCLRFSPIHQTPNVIEWFTFVRHGVYSALLKHLANVPEITFSNTISGTHVFIFRIKWNAFLQSTVTYVLKFSIEMKMFKIDQPILNSNISYGNIYHIHFFYTMWTQGPCNASQEICARFAILKL